jgi:hypothetical protein
MKFVAKLFGSAATILVPLLSLVAVAYGENKQLSAVRIGYQKYGTQSGRQLRKIADGERGHG